MSSFANRPAKNPALRPLHAAWVPVLLLILVIAGCAPGRAPMGIPGERADTRVEAVPMAADSRQQSILTEIIAAELAAARGRFEAASERYAQAARQSPDPAVTARALELAMLAQQPDRALALAERWVAIAPESVEAAQVLAVMQLRRGRLEAARDTVLAGLPVERPAREAAIARLGAVLLAQFPGRDGLALMQAVTDARPASAAAQLALARLALAREALGRAHDAVDRALAQRPEWTAARLLQADILLAEGEGDAALAILEGLLEQAPDNQALRSEYAGLLAQLGRDAAALTQYRALLAAGETGRRALTTGAVLAIEAEDWQLAGELLDRLRTAHPDLGVRAYLLEADMLRSQQRYTRSIALFDTALETYPGNVDLRYGRALSRILAGRTKGGVAELRGLVDAQPDNPRYLNALGYTLVDETAQIEEGAALIRRAHELAPDDPAVIDSMGWAAYRLGRMEEALEYLREAHARSDGDAEIAAHLGEVLWVLGQKREARQVWAAARATAPDHPVLLETLERLQP